MISSSSLIPREKELEKLLDLDGRGAVADLIGRSLLEPISEFLSRPSKRFRGQFVGIGFGLIQGIIPRGGDEAEQCARGAELLEALHAGSLVVDDVQDDSKERRGRETLHRRHGVGLAINAGNWLYFRALETVREWGLPSEREVAVYRTCHRALTRAHFGQALDVGVPVDALEPARIREVVLASMELKTGALMALALGLGGVLAGANDGQLEALDAFGRRFGIALQMLDDVGNAGAPAGDPKRYEDLRLRRPTWLWAVAASRPAAEFEGFCAAVRELPAEAAVERWLADSGLRGHAYEEACRFLDLAMEELENRLPPEEGQEGPEALAAVRSLGEKLKGAYGTGGKG